MKNNNYPIKAGNVVWSKKNNMLNDIAGIMSAILFLNPSARSRQIRELINPPAINAPWFPENAVRGKSKPILIHPDQIPISKLVTINGSIRICFLFSIQNFSPLSSRNLLLPEERILRHIPKKKIIIAVICPREKIVIIHRMKCSSS